jgi:signal peptidase
MRSLGRHGAITLCWAAMGLALGLLAAIAVPMLVGFRSFTVMSGSMQPAIETGDLVMVRPITPRAAGIGDVLTFEDPNSAGRTITHRVRSARVEGKVVHFETKGDANNKTERWTVPVDGRVGRVNYRLAKVGYGFRLAASPLGRMALVGVPTLALGVLVLISIWRPARPARPTPHDEVPSTPAEPAPPQTVDRDLADAAVS